MTTILSEDVIATRIAALRGKTDLGGSVPAQGAGTCAPEPPSYDQYEYVRPISDATKAFLEVVENPGNRFTLGLPEIDVLTRGFGPSELVMLGGFAGSGKTQLASTAIVNNAGRRVLFFSLDDPAEMVAVKLVSMKAHISGDDIEKRVRAKDPEIHDLLSTAVDQFPLLVIIDTPLSFDNMQRAIDEATRHWGAPPECIIIDYLVLIPVDLDIPSKADELRRITKNWDWPTLCLHQGTRGQCPPGKPFTLTSMAFGGEQQGTMVLGTRRKAEDEEADHYDRKRHENTVTIHLVKNKRPPSKRTSYEGIDFFLDPETGMIRPLKTGDLRVHTGPTPPEMPLTTQERLIADTFGVETEDIHF